MFPVIELRKKLLDLLNNNTLWDKNIAELLVTKTDTNSMELRASFSAKNATDLWNLRCNIRENLIKFIQENYSDAFPTVRLKDLNNSKN